MDNLQEAIAVYMVKTGDTKQAIASRMGFKSVQTLNSRLTGSSDITVTEALDFSKMLGIGIEDVCEMIVNPK